MGSNDRLPWHEEPRVDQAQATERAINAATHRSVDANSPAIKAWAATAIDKEIRILSGTSEGRNNQLFKSAANLFEIVAAGALSETEVTDALVDACHSNGLSRDKGGMSQVMKTLESGRRHGYDSPRDLSLVGLNTNGSGALAATEVVQQSVTLTDVFALERGFWTSRESLKTIYLAALSRMCSPWSVLGYCAARALALVRPSCQLPPIIGGPGSLNWFCAITAQSGGGKGSSMAVARELIREQVYVRNLGSGEGMVDAFYEKDPNDDAPGRRETVMFVADEIDSMTALGSRSGSTLMGTLRSAFSGESLGFTYRSNKNHLEPHSYRMTLVINVQPARAGSLMEDRHGGTLQRFMWFPGTDPRITTEIPPMPAPLTMPHAGSWRCARELKVPYETIELIRDERARSASGLSDDPLAGHALYMREKFAYALAVLDGRDVMTLEDWRLSGIAARVSDHTRQWVESELHNIQVEEDTERGRRQGTFMGAADEERVSFAETRKRRIAKVVLQKITTADEKGYARGDLNKAIAYRDRPYLQSALDWLAERGDIQKVEGSKSERWERMVKNAP